jgi:prefoldin alpha subunit
MTKEIIVDEEKEKKTQKRNPEAKLQEKVMTYRMLQSHMQEIRKEAELVERKYIEVEASRQFLEDLKKGKTDTEVLLPVGAGIFAKGKLTDKNLLIDIGAGVLSGKSVDKVTVIVEEQKTEIEAAVKKLNKDMKDTVQKLNELGPELQALSG